jgi:hypothetical protein
MGGLYGFSLKAENPPKRVLFCDFFQTDGIAGVSDNTDDSENKPKGNEQPIHFPVDESILSASTFATPPMTAPTTAPGTPANPPTTAPAVAPVRARLTVARPDSALEG